MIRSDSIAQPPPKSLDEVEALLEHFAVMESQFRQIREGLTHSHRLATLGTIATVIAHEYNNILTPIISYAQLALADQDDPELMRKAVEKALDGAERAAKISSSLLGFSASEDNRQVALLPTVVDESLACLGRHPSKDGIELVTDLPATTVAMSPLNLQQVLVNLILNARKVMRRRGGRLEIRAKDLPDTVEIEVADTGPGIPPAILDDLFEPFVTRPVDEPQSSGEQKGTGLGLCICRDLIQQAGGSISASNSEAGGAVFRMTLPRALPENAPRDDIKQA